MPGGRYKDETPRCGQSCGLVGMCDGRCGPASALSPSERCLWFPLAACCLSSGEDTFQTAWVAFNGSASTFVYGATQVVSAVVLYTCLCVSCLLPCGCGPSRLNFNLPVLFSLCLLLDYTPPKVKCQQREFCVPVCVDFCLWTWKHALQPQCACLCMHELDRHPFIFEHYTPSLCLFPRCSFRAIRAIWLWTVLHNSLLEQLACNLHSLMIWPMWLNYLAWQMKLQRLDCELFEKKKQASWYWALPCESSYFC